MKAIVTTLFNGKNYTETIDFISTTKQVHISSDTHKEDDFAVIHNIFKRMKVREYIDNHFNFKSYNDFVIDENNNVRVSTAVYTTD